MLRQEKFMDAALAIATSAAVAALVGGLVAYFSQRRLLERKAQLDYDYASRSRLLGAIGPARMQLLFACRDLIGRITRHPGGAWDMRPDEPYVRSWVYRFLAPLAIAQVIERQVSAADFSVDASALELLIFLSRAERMLTTTDVVKDDPRVDLSRQTQHLFRDNLRAAAAKLIVVDQQGEARVTDYGTFLQRQGLETDGALQALVMIFTRCNSSLLENPVFWVRLVDTDMHVLGSWNRRGRASGLSRNRTPFQACFRG
jgi:hypothetical protein